MDAEWKRLLASPEYLGDLYNGDAPSRRSCNLFYLHIDERDSSLTLGFDTRQFPSNPHQDWVDRGFNAFEFHLVFTGVTNLRVTGWETAVTQHVHFSTNHRGEFTVSLGSKDSGVFFHAASARLDRSRAYLAATSVS